MQHHKINYIEFPVKDIAKTKDFFGQAFGWSFKDFGEEYCAIGNAGIDAGFYLVDAQQDMEVSTKKGSVLMVIYSRQLEATQAKLESLGALIIQPIFSFPGGRRFHFSDCNNNEFAVWSDR